VNDVIVKVAQGAEEPVDVSGYETTDAVKLIRGNLGTEVRLTIRKPDGSYKIVALKREKQRSVKKIKRKKNLSLRLTLHWKEKRVLL